MSVQLTTGVTVAVAPPPGHPVGVVVLPVPGPPGRPGDSATLTPQQLADITTDTAASVNAELDPDVPFVLTFDNALA